jgi:hypothetical protein
MKPQEHRILKKYGEKIGREQLSVRIIELCKMVAQEENYKNAVTVAGHIQALAIACGYECYWNEKKDNGYYKELERAKRMVGVTD